MMPGPGVTEPNTWCGGSEVLYGDLTTSNGQILESLVENFFVLFYCHADDLLRVVGFAFPVSLLPFVIHAESSLVLPSNYSCVISHLRAY